MPAHPQINEFLRSSDSLSMRLHVHSLPYARTIASRFRGHFDPHEKHSARADAGGRGKGAYVDIFKTEGWLGPALAQCVAEVAAMRACGCSNHTSKPRLREPPEQAPVDSGSARS